MASLHWRKAPSGDPNIPEEVLFVKESKQLVCVEAIIGVGNEKCDLERSGGFVNTDIPVRPHIIISSVLTNRNSGGAEVSSTCATSHIASPSRTACACGSHLSGCSTSNPSDDMPARTTEG